MSLPPSSPRLPSPPPPAEIQIGPKSPLMGPDAARQAVHMEQTVIDTNSKRRIHPGTKSADMAAGPPLVPLHELDSAFQLQEHLAALHYYHTASHTTPITRETAKLLATPPPGIDKTLWLYELCRFLIAQCNSLIVGFLFDTPACSAATCPEMRAGEWQFLCAVHDAPKSCCAIDYCCHTLDWAANVVTNPKIFPSRFVVDAHDKNMALKNLVNVFRRLHRIFAHAWFQHRGVFWAVEGQSGLYVFFKTVCDVYDVLPAENYKLPPEAEGLDSHSGSGDLGDRSAERRQQQHQPTGPISIAKPPGPRGGGDADQENYPSASRTNTRRHIKSSPSTGSAVTTVPEADEGDERAELSSRMREMRISAPAPADQELELASIPVIVEHRPPPAAEQPLRPPSVVPPPDATTAGSMGERPPEPQTDASKLEAEAIPGPDPNPVSELAPTPRPGQEEPQQVPLQLHPEPEPESQLEAHAQPPEEAQHESEQQPSTAAADDPGPIKPAAAAAKEADTASPTHDGPFGAASDDDKTSGAADSEDPSLSVTAAAAAGGEVEAAPARAETAETSASSPAEAAAVAGGGVEGRSGLASSSHGSAEEDRGQEDHEAEADGGEGDGAGEGVSLAVGGPKEEQEEEVKKEEEGEKEGGSGGEPEEGTKSSGEEGRADGEE